VSTLRPSCVVRADGNPEMGLGHLARSLTLAAALAQEGFGVTFLSASPVDQLFCGQSAGVRFRPLQADAGTTSDASAVLEHDPDVIVIDGYHFDDAYFQALEESGARCVVLADGHTSAARPIAVIDQNPNATSAAYSDLEGSPLLLLGLRYALVRPEIIGADASGRNPGPYVFVSIGGSDPRGLTVPLAAALAARDLETKVALGQAVRDRARAEAALAALDGVEVVPGAAFAQCLADSSVALVGAGGTMWEGAALGVPMVAIVTADNQAGPSAAAEDLGFLLRHDCRRTCDPEVIADQAADLLRSTETRRVMSSTGRAAVDNNGARRVASHLAAVVAEGATSQ